MVPGGKGVNVARTIHTLGEKVRLLGFAGGVAGDFIRQGLRREGIEADLVTVPGESRTCLAIVDPANGTETIINEVGPTVSAEARVGFLTLFDQSLADVDLVTLSGSLLPGLPDTFYAALIERAAARRVPCILDTSGPALREGLAARPFVVKPNRAEAEALTGVVVRDVDSALVAARKLVEQSRMALVTLGEDGAVLATNAGAWHARPPAVKVVNTVGSGDSFTAGFAVALARGLPPIEALRLGTACAAANAMRQGAGQARREDVEALLARVHIRAL
jgi:tagatose 6-phosphate kinase